MVYVHFIIVCFQLQELLFCETCDTVFCTLCTGGTHKPGIAGNNTGNSPTHSGGTDSGNNSPTHQTAVSNTADHTVIPFSIAIKRMSEILIYKANECTAKLDEATEIVNAEIHRLDHNADSAFENVNARFQAALDAIGTCPHLAISSTISKLCHLFFFHFFFKLFFLQNPNVKKSYQKSNVNVMTRKRSWKISLTSSKPKRPKLIPTFKLCNIKLKCETLRKKSLISIASWTWSQHCLNHVKIPT